MGYPFTVGCPVSFRSLALWLQSRAGASKPSRSAGNVMSSIVAVRSQMVCTQVPLLPDLSVSDQLRSTLPVTLTPPTSVEQGRFTNWSACTRWLLFRPPQFSVKEG